jgi:hypothetical protein
VSRHSKPFELYTPHTSIPRWLHVRCASANALAPPELRATSVRGTADPHVRAQRPLHSTVPGAHTHAAPERTLPAGHENPHGSDAAQMGDAPVG